MVDIVVDIRNQLHKLSKVFFQIINLYYTGITITVKADMEYNIAYTENQ